MAGGERQEPVSFWRQPLPHVSETCICGARFEFIADKACDVQQAVSEWRADHQVCRINAAALTSGASA